MSEMIDRVTKVLAEKLHDAFTHKAIPVRELAIAAIEAMREPTIEMCRDAAWDDYGPDACQTCWRTMIDLALAL